MTAIVSISLVEIISAAALWAVFLCMQPADSHGSVWNVLFSQ
jgi:hypothetical protein